jgi:uncharacterized protein YggT (Ycf19 family)
VNRVTADHPDRVRKARPVGGTVAVMAATPAPLPPQAVVPEASAPPSDDARLWILRVAKWVVLFIYVVVILNLVVLSMGFVLRLFGASTDASFTRWVYRNVERIMEPFRGMFPSHPVTDRSVIDFSLLFAMIVYACVGIALHAAVAWLASKIAEIQRRERRRRQAARAMASPTATGAAGGGYVDAAEQAARPYP